MIQDQTWGRSRQNTSVGSARSQINLKNNQNDQTKKVAQHRLSSPFLFEVIGHQVKRSQIILGVIIKQSLINEEYEQLKIFLIFAYCMKDSCIVNSPALVIVNLVFIRATHTCHVVPLCAIICQ